MPTVESNTSSHVLITGGNGYIGMWVIRFLLEQGYAVRAAVRSEDKGNRLQEYFHDKVKWVVVEDITKVSHQSSEIYRRLIAFCQDGAFDDAVRDVDGIIHMASPVDSSSVEPDGI